MDDRFVALAAAASNRHGVFTTGTARKLGISDRLRHEWLVLGRIERLGTHTFRFAGSPTTWHMTLAAALDDLGSQAAIAGRSASVLQHLDGFVQGTPELWVPRSMRRHGHAVSARSSARPLLTGDVVIVDGLRCVTAERLILDASLFRFTTDEINNAIDSALRLRLVSERRLRRRIVDDLPGNAPNRRALIGAMVDTGGESALERRFLAIVRQAGLPRPLLQRTYRSGTRTMARVDAEFAGGLIIEVAGHGTHSTRLQRQRDAQRHTELTLRGNHVITFTYDDVYGRPQWVLGTLRTARVAIAA